jgi:Tfp pilus assembly protein PilN
LLLWGTTLICCVSYGHFQHAQLAEARAETAELELRCLPIRVATERSQVMQRELQRIASQLGEWDARERREVPLAVVGVISAATNQQLDELQLNRLRIEHLDDLKPTAPGSTRQAARSTADPESATTKIELTGTAINDAAVGQFINNLRSAGLFSVVELVSTQAVQTTMGQAREFRVRCAF